MTDLATTFVSIPDNVLEEMEHGPGSTEPEETAGLNYEVVIGDRIRQYQRVSRSRDEHKAWPNRQLGKVSLHNV